MSQSIMHGLSSEFKVESLINISKSDAVTTIPLTDRPRVDKLKSIVKKDQFNELFKSRYCSTDDVLRSFDHDGLDCYICDFPNQTSCFMKK